MDKLKQILNRIPYTVLVFVYLAKLGYDYYSFTSDPSSALILKKTEATSAEARVRALELKKKQAMEFFNSLEKKKTDLRELFKTLGEMKVSLSEQLDVPGFIKQVTNEAKSVRLRIKSFQPSKEEPGTHYIKHVFDVEFTGVYVQVLAFMQRLGNFKSVVKVEDFQIRSNGRSDRKFVDISGTLRLAAFTYNTSVADEMGKELNDSAPAAPTPGVPPKKGGA